MVHISVSLYNCLYNNNKVSHYRFTWPMHCCWCPCGPSVLPCLSVLGLADYKGKQNISAQQYHGCKVPWFLVTHYNINRSGCPLDSSTVLGCIVDFMEVFACLQGGLPLYLNVPSTAQTDWRYFIYFGLCHLRHRFSSYQLNKTHDIFTHTSVRPLGIRSDHVVLFVYGLSHVIEPFMMLL